MSWREFDILLRGLSAESVTAIKIHADKSKPPVIDDPKAGWYALKGALGIAGKSKRKRPVTANG